MTSWWAVHRGDGAGDTLSVRPALTRAGPGLAKDPVPAFSGQMHQFLTPSEPHLLAFALPVGVPTLPRLRAAHIYLSGARSRGLGGSCCVSLTHVSASDALDKEPPLYAPVSLTPTISFPHPRTQGRRGAAVGVITPRSCVGGVWGSAEQRGKAASPGSPGRAAA